MTHFGTPSVVFNTSAIELVCVNGVVVSARDAGHERVDPREARATSGRRAGSTSDRSASASAGLAEA